MIDLKLSRDDGSSHAVYKAPDHVINMLSERSTDNKSFHKSFLHILQIR